jgi:hypothetical protein
VVVVVAAAAAGDSAPPLSPGDGRFDAMAQLGSDSHENEACGPPVMYTANWTTQMRHYSHGTKVLVRTCFADSGCILVVRASTICVTTYKLSGGVVAKDEVEEWKRC